MERCIFTATAQSKTVAAVYTIEICKICPKECAVFEDKDHFRELCRVGCPTFGCKWSCPPHAPGFTAISSGWSNLYVLYMRMPMQYFSHIKNSYLRIRAANSMLKSRADRFMRPLDNQYGKHISTGSCRLCKPCRIRENKPCAHPSAMAYSFEALGINVGALVDYCFDRPLLWYKKGSLPEYTSVVSGLLTNEQIALDSIKRDYLLY